MKKIFMRQISRLFIASILFLWLSVPVLPAFAATDAAGILPKGDVSECEVFNMEEISAYDDPEVIKDYALKGDDYNVRALLGCAISTGNVHLWMLGYFVNYAIRFALVMGGLVSTFFIILGGYRYMVGGVTDDKESGKKTIIHAIIGLVLSLLAYLLVSVVQIFVTS